jgi:hypothetical protein
LTSTEHTNVMSRDADEVKDKLLCVPGTVRRSGCRMSVHVSQYLVLEEILCIILAHGEPQSTKDSPFTTNWSYCCQKDHWSAAIKNLKLLY